MRRLCFHVKSLLPSTDRRKGCLNCCRLPPTINQDHLQGELAVMCVLHCIRAERLTLSCRWWGCTAGYAEWSHPAACLSWCRNLQTCRSAEKRTKRKKGTAVSVFANCLWGGACTHDQSWPVTVIRNCTWFLSDIRKSSRDPGNPNSIKVFTSRRSALFPGSRREMTTRAKSESALTQRPYKSLKEVL